MGSSEQNTVHGGSFHSAAVISQQYEGLGGSYTDKNENQIFLIYKEIQSGAVAKSYMRKGFLIYEEIGNCSVLNFLIYKENFILFFCRLGVFTQEITFLR
jgi:hypothetical protein